MRAISNDATQLSEADAGVVALVAARARCWSRSSRRRFQDAIEAYRQASRQRSPPPSNGLRRAACTSTQGQAPLERPRRGPVRATSGLPARNVLPVLRTRRAGAAFLRLRGDRSSRHRPWKRLSCTAGCAQRSATIDNSESYERQLSD